MKKVLSIMLFFMILFTTACSDRRGSKIKSDNFNEKDYSNLTNNLYIKNTIKEKENKKEILKVASYSLNKIKKEDVVSSFDEGSSMKFEEIKAAEGIRALQGKKGNAELTISEDEFGSVKYFEYRKDINKYDYYSMTMTFLNGQNPKYKLSSEELKFKSVEEIRMQAKELLKKLFPGIEFNLEISSIKEENMKDYREQIGGKDKSEKSVEDIYYVRVIPKINDLEVVSNSFIGAPETQFSVITNNIGIIYTKDGLDTVLANSISVPGEQVGKISSINILDSKLMEIIKKSFSNTLDGSNVYIENIRVVLLPEGMVNKKETKLIPTWEVKFISADNDGEKIKFRYFKIPDGEMLNND